MLMAKRSGKFYSKNEKDVMAKLGLTPTKQSGAGWIEKEDGYNDVILAQLKSTDARSYKFSLDDWYKLLYHANSENKKPLFVLQFLEDDEQLLVLRKQDLKDITMSLLNLKSFKDVQFDTSEIEIEQYCIDYNKKIKSNSKARDNFYKEREKLWQQKK